MDRGAWCRLLSMGLQRVGHDWATSLSFFGNQAISCLIETLKWGLPWWLSGKESTFSQCRRPEFDPWSRRIPHPQAHVPQWPSLCFRAQELPLLSQCPATTEALCPRARALQQEKPPRWGACTAQWRVACPHHSWESPHKNNEDKAQPKTNKYNYI